MVRTALVLRQNSRLDASFGGLFEWVLLTVLSIHQEFDEIVSATQIFILAELEDHEPKQVARLAH